MKKDPSSVFSSCLWAGGDRGVRESRRPRPRGADRGVTRAAGGRPLSPAGRVGMPGQSGVGGTRGGGRASMGLRCGSAGSRHFTQEEAEASPEPERGPRASVTFSETRGVLGLQPSAASLLPCPPTPQPAAQLPPLPSSQLRGLPSALWLSRTPSLNRPSSSCSLRFPSTGEAQKGPVTCPRPHRTHHTPS